jgi:hypothetical protein
MLCLDKEIDSALKKDIALVKLLGGERIYEFNEPGDKDVPYPEVVYEEISNVPNFSADDQESMSRITYSLSITSEKNLIEIINAVERIMVSIYFVRHSLGRTLRGLPVGVKGKEIYFVTIRECNI